MKLIISLFFILILTSFNSNAADTPADTFDKQLEDYIEGKNNKLPDTNIFNNEQLNEFLKKNKISNKQFELIKEREEKKFDIQKLKPFLFLAIIIFAVLSSLNRETIENTTKPKKLSKN